MSKILELWNERVSLSYSKWKLAGDRAQLVVCLMVSLLCNKRKRCSERRTVSQTLFPTKHSCSSCREFRKTMKRRCWECGVVSFENHRSRSLQVYVFSWDSEIVWCEAFRVWKTNLECNDRKRLLGQSYGRSHTQSSPRPWFDRWYQITLSMSSNLYKWDRTGALMSLCCKTCDRS